MKKITLLVLLVTVGQQLMAQGTFTSLATGNWNAAGSWTLSSGSDADNIPDADDNVTVTTHTITLTADAACNNLTLQGTSGNRAAVSIYTLTVSGTLSGSTSSPSTSLVTTTTGKVLFVGASRALFAASPNWGANVPNWRCEIALDAGATGTASTSVKFGDLTVTSGTFDASGDIRIDKGTDGQGTVSIASGATVIARGWLGSRTGTASTFCASVTVDGTLDMRGNNLNGTTITINGILKRSSSTLALGSNPTGISASDFVYGTTSELLYEAGTASGTLQIGLEIDRNNSATLSSVPPKITVNVGAANRLSVNSKSVSCGTLALQSGIVYTGISGRLAADVVTGGDASNFVCTCTTSGAASTSAIPLTINNVGTTPITFHVGPLPTAYNPAIIANNGSVDNFSVRVQTSVSSPSGTTYVNREWNISEATAGGSNADLTLQWNASEEALGFDRTASYISHGLGWRQLASPTAAGGGDPYTQTVTGYTDGFSPFAVASSGALPLELLFFTGKTLTSTNLLQWASGEEKNAEAIVIERSADQQAWSFLAEVAPRGSHSNYQLEDRAPLAKAYYRLRVIDTDGSEQLSNVLILNRRDKGFGITAAFPSPTADLVTVQFNTPEEERVTLRVTDFTGRLVLEQSFEAVKGSNTASLSLANLPAGAYTVTVGNASTVAEPVRVVKQ